MRRLLLSLLGIAICLQSFAQISFAPNPMMPLPENVKLYYNTSTDYNGRFGFVSPTWFIWADGPCTAEQAEAIVASMGLNDKLKDYVGMFVVVFSPANGKTYDKKADFEVYKTVFEKLRVFVNLKVIGIGSGATFVNECIAPIAHEVAGIFCYGGKAAAKIEGPATVPVYLAGKDAAKAAKAYISRDNAKRAESGKNLKVYRNTEEPLLQVYVNTRPGSFEQAFEDAWDKLLSVNYRCSNLGHTGYMGGLLGQYGDYELEPYLMWNRLGTERIIVDQALFKYNKQEDKYLWFEYIPDCLKDAEPKSLPLVILLHGHNNDPRTQAETSGFVELGAREGFVVAELEWQGKGEYAYMGDHGIEAVVRTLLDKYPQIDPSRVYAEGLSAGGFSATALGVRKSHLFAAVGAHSGGMFGKGFGLGFPFMEPESLKAEAAQKSGLVTMPFFSICGTADDAVPFNNPELPNGNTITDSWRLYQLLNGIEVSGPTDLEKYPLFGLPLENRHRIETVKHHAMETGDLLDSEGHPIIRIVAVENFGHWNFVPGALQMWEFFKHWRRDPSTLISVYCE